VDISIHLVNTRKSYAKLTKIARSISPIHDNSLIKSYLSAHQSYLRNAPNVTVGFRADPKRASIRRGNLLRDWNKLKFKKYGLSVAQFYFTPTAAELSFLVASETSPSQPQGRAVQASSSSATTREVEPSPDISDEANDDDHFRLESHVQIIFVHRLSGSNMDTLRNEFLANVEERQIGEYSNQVVWI
jgi:hypothetical protein